MRYRVYFVPATLSSTICVSCLISCSIRKCENEDPVSIPIFPAPIQNIPIWVSLVPGTVLFGHFPSSSENVTVGEKVRTLSIALVCPELAYVLVTSI